MRLLFICGTRLVHFAETSCRQLQLPGKPGQSNPTLTDPRISYTDNREIPNRASLQPPLFMVH